jgi:PhzF family phenazine biosynthesis protein
MPIAQLPITYVDVFTRAPLLGSPVAVVFGAEGLSDLELQRVAQWTNLSETTFVLPSQWASHRLRSFTPRTELPFAGHPTLGSAHAVGEAGLVPTGQRQLTQECAAGLIPLSVDEQGLAHARVPRPRLLPLAQPAETVAHLLERALGGRRAVAPALIDVGPRWLVARVDGTRVNQLSVDLSAMARLCHGLGALGVTVYAVPSEESLREELRMAASPSEQTPATQPGWEEDRGSSPSVVVRSFVPDEGVAEDPVCGSGNAAVAAHLSLSPPPTDLGNPYVAAQGEPIGRRGRVLVRRDGDDVTIGGHCVTVINGTLRLHERGAARRGRWTPELDSNRPTAQRDGRPTGWSTTPLTVTSSTP